MKPSIKIRSHSMTSAVVAALVALTGAANSRLVVAQPAEFPAKKVAYGDLNLDSNLGAKVLYARLRYAAQNVCAPVEDIRDLGRQSVWQHCVDKALAAAVKQVNAPKVNALYKQTANRSSEG